MILVTGGTGLLGSRLLYDLAKTNNTIRATYRNPKRLDFVKKVFKYDTQEGRMRFEKIEWIVADILDIPSMQKAFENISEVYHAAAIVSFDRKDAHHVLEINHTGTANVVNLALKHQIKKLCYVSSISAFSSEKQPIDEKSYWNPEESHSLYGYSKHLGEMEVWRISQEGIPVIVIYPGIILGKGHEESFASIMPRIIKKYEPKYSFPGRHAYIDVRDASSSIIALMKSRIINQSYILISERHEFEKVHRLFSKYLNCKTAKKIASPKLLNTVRVFESVFNAFGNKPKILTKDSVQFFCSRHAYDNSKIRNFLKHQFQYSIEESIATVCKACFEEKTP